MSIHVMNLVWRNARYQGNAMLALLALADWSSDEGVSWPSVESIAKKSRQSERNARIVLHKLIEDGVLVVTERENKSSIYQINLERVSTTGANIAPLKSSARGGKRLPYRGANSDQKTEMFAPNTSIEPSVDTSSKPSSSAVDNGDGKVFLLTPPQEKTHGLQYRLQKHIEDWYFRENQMKCAWGPTEAGMLATVIKRHGDNPEDILFRCVDSRFKSDFMASLEPAGWIPKLLNYKHGPLDEFGKLRAGRPQTSAPSVADELRKQGIEPMPSKGRR